MSNFCDEREEEVTPADCEECKEDCEWSGYTVPIAGKTEQVAAVPEPSEVEKLFREKLNLFFGGDIQRVDRAISNLMPELKSLVVSQAKEMISEAIKKYIADTVAGMIDGRMKEIFDVALAEKIITIKDGDDAAMIQTVQEVVCLRIKRFLAEKDSYNERDFMKKRVDEVISARVDSMIKPAIEELKAETAEKFTREMMKKMMQGMVKSIAGDKKLLAAMDLD